MDNHYVEIVKHDHSENEVVKSMGPFPEWKADRIEAGASRNLNHEEYFTRVVQR